LSALAVCLSAGLLGACSAADQGRVADTLRKVAAASKGLGMRVSLTGTLSAGGAVQPIASRATIAPGGRRAKITTEIAGTVLRQYLDGHFLLMNADAFPSAAVAPPGTRYLRFDIDAVNRSVGIDSTLRELQQIDPGRTAALLAKVADVKDVGTGTIRGVDVTRYSATVNLGKLVRELSNGESAKQLPAMFGDSDMRIELSIDKHGLVRGYRMAGTIGPARMDLEGEVTTYSRDLKVEVPSGPGVYDITDDVVGALAGAGGQTS